MKKFLLLFALVLSGTVVFSQAKRYIWLEHFTNTECRTCAASNPGFYNVLKNYKDQYHHITIHPRIPYSSCVLYNLNKTEQDLRMSLYSITGTPTVVVQGLTKRTASSVTAAILDAEKAKTSPIEVIVSESGTTSRTASVKIITRGNKPGSNYKIYAAIAEKQLDLATGNGEKVHHNAFRKFVTAADGDIIQLAETGNSVEKSFSYTVDSKWKESEIYLLVWVQDVVTREVLNSGAKFDIISSTYNPTTFGDISIYPNPVQDLLNVQLDKALPTNTNVYLVNIIGKVIETHELRAGATKLSIPVANYQKGIYFVRLENGKNRLAKKWPKA